MKIGEEKKHLLGLAQDLHPLDNAHTERTINSGILSQRRYAAFLYSAKQQK